MKILVVGSGAREHALVWKISQSERVEKIYCAPGNGGTAELAENINIKDNDIETLLAFAMKEKIDLTVVGPEEPLVKGIVDKFRENDLKIFGPNKKGALLEGSKSYAKEFMYRNNIPTANYKVYTEIDKAREGLNEFRYPLVIKADGLAGGKGVVICSNNIDAEKALQNIMKDKKFGKAGDRIVIEEFLEGIEASLLCVLDGNNLVPLESARDYKKIYDGGKGPNTGGMGCFSPNNIFTDELKKNIKKQILNNIMKGLKLEKIDYKGILFIGLMITENGPKVLEFNVRMGDPETEVVLSRLKTDIIDVFEKSLDGKLEDKDLKWTTKTSLCVVASSQGYPFKYEKGKKIEGLNEVDDDVIVFHAGTKKDGNDIITNGGRVLTVTSLGNNLEETRKKVYENMNKLNFEGMHYRKDIGKI